jgi:hypothetical protein
MIKSQAQARFMRSLSVHVKSRTRPSHTCHSYSIQIPSGWGISKLLTQQGFMHVLLLFRFRPSRMLLSQFMRTPKIVQMNAGHVVAFISGTIFSISDAIDP